MEPVGQQYSTPWPQAELSDRSVVASRSSGWAAVPFQARICLLVTLGLSGALVGVLLMVLIEETPVNYIAGGSFAGVCLLFALIGAGKMLKAQQRQAAFLHSGNDSIALAEHSPKAGTSASSLLGLELQEGDLVLEKALKRGNFGEVWRGKLVKTDQVVAVKVLPANTRSVMGNDDLVTEIKVMRHIQEKGTHPNVTQMLGFSLSMPPQLVLEFIETGSLEDFLKSMSANDVPMEDEIAVDFSLQVAKGMKFVADAGVVHRDLASRNVLITADNVLKVCDFGLARVVGQAGIFNFKPKGYCIKKQSNPTAFRWTPPEGFKEMALSGDPQVPHTEKGDVWSFAVVMMEICTRGEQPYEADIKGSNKEKVFNFLLEGKRMRQGPMPDGMYSLALRCWDEDPDGRPDFALVIRELGGKPRQTAFSSFMNLMPF